MARSQFSVLLVDGQVRTTVIDTSKGGNIGITDGCIAFDLGPGKVEYTYPLANVLEIITTPLED